MWEYCPVRAETCDDERIREGRALVGQQLLDTGHILERLRVLVVRQDEDEIRPRVGRLGRRIFGNIGRRGAE